MDLRGYFENHSGCFALARVMAEITIEFGRKDSHVWATVFGPEAGGIIAAFAGVDLNIDPWPDGGQTLIPSSVPTPQLFLTQQGFK
jgi:hypothetical protein